MSEKAFITEIFSSVQGEGVYIGCHQIFVRLSGCIFNCPYCDTDYEPKPTFFVNDKEYKNPITSDELVEILFNDFDLSIYHSISFTGGEPLLQADFLDQVATLIKIDNTDIALFLETSGLVTDEILRFDGLMDIMSIDIKMHTSDVLDNLPILLSKLLKLQSSSYYLKLLTPSNINFIYIDKVIKCLSDVGISGIIIQPINNKIDFDVVENLMARFYKKNITARVIPQTHKYLDFR